MLRILAYDTNITELILQNYLWPALITLHTVVVSTSEKTHRVIESIELEGLTQVQRLELGFVEPEEVLLRPLLVPL